MRNASALIASLALGVVTMPAQATITVLNQWHLGEADAGAAAGGAGAAATVDSVGGFNLSKVGTPTYSADVPANIGSNLSLAFNGTTDEYMNSSGVASTLTVNFGIEAWVKSNGSTSGNAAIAYNGNTSTANQTVIVDDVTAPVAPTLANATGECSVTVTAPTANVTGAGAQKPEASIRDARSGSTGEYDDAGLAANLAAPAQAIAEKFEGAK